MKKTNDKLKWYILIAIALLLGILIGYFATQQLDATGAAKAIVTFKQTSGSGLKSIFIK